jgi:hypothetical protein
MVDGLDTINIQFVLNDKMHQFFHHCQVTTIKEQFYQKRQRQQLKELLAGTLQSLFIKSVWYLHYLMLCKILKIISKSYISWMLYPICLLRLAILLTMDISDNLCQVFVLERNHYLILRKIKKMKFSRCCQMTIMNSRISLFSLQK